MAKTKKRPQDTILVDEEVKPRLFEKERKGRGYLDSSMTKSRVERKKL